MKLRSLGIHRHPFPSMGSAKRRFRFQDVAEGARRSTGSLLRPCGSSGKTLSMWLRI
jgi:hypothetical protein